MAQEWLHDSEAVLLAQQHMMAEEVGTIGVVNRETGQPPTEREQRAIDAHAIKVLSSPYSAPEQVAWVVDCASPAVVERWFFTRWENCRQIGINRRRD